MILKYICARIHTRIYLTEREYIKKTTFEIMKESYNLSVLSPLKWQKMLNFLAHLNVCRVYPVMFWCYIREREAIYTVMYLEQTYKMCAYVGKRAYWFSSHQNEETKRALYVLWIQATIILVYTILLALQAYQQRAEITIHVVVWLSLSILLSA